MTIDPKYALGDIVWLKTDREEIPRMISGLVIRPTGILYTLACGEKEGTHYDIELSAEKPSATKSGAGFKR